MRLTLWLLHMMFLSALVSPCCGRTTTVRPSPTKLPAAVVFAREKDQQAQIVWRELASANEHVVFKLKSWGPVPDQFGYLPSPNGQWLLVWFMPDYPKTERTRWVLIHLANGKIIKIGDTPGEPVLFPYWRDNQHLEFDGMKKTAIYDVTQLKLLQPLPQDKLDYHNKIETRFLSFVHRHYSMQWKLWQASLGKLKKPYAFHDWLKEYSGFAGEPKEYLMLRSLGVPSLGELQRYPHEGFVVRSPYLAVSFNGDNVARSHYYDHYMEFPDEDGRVAKIHAAGYYMQILDVHSSKPIWGLKIPPRRIRLPKETNRGPMGARPLRFPWIEAYITAIRWSSDGRYVSFYISRDIPESATRIVDVSTKKQMLRLPGAFNAFVIPSPAASPANAP